MKKRTIIILLILILSIYALNINVQSAEENNYRPTSLELTPHDPISITSDSDFEVFPGSGTAEDPYVIEGYNITTADSRGISIIDTTKYFIVRDCYVDAEDYGIYIRNVVDSTATVINNTCTNNWRGISLDLYGSLTVTNNTCNNNEYGIVLASSSSSTVTNNTCNNNNNWGIYLYHSGSSTVVNNTCSSNNWNGIYLCFSNSSTVAGNTCSNNDFEGIILCFSDNSTVTNNTCTNNWNGISLGSSNSSTVANNTCSSNNWNGISLGSSNSSTVANNTCSKNSNEGILFMSSSSSTVVNNTCNNNDWGIFLAYSDFCVVTYNLLQENEGYGVVSSYDSDNNFIHHNTFVSNNIGGISQAYDDGTNNTWYDSVTFKGNYWSDWLGIGSYYIQGSALSFDKYPLGEPLIVEYPQFLLLTLLLSVVPLFLTRIISKKVKK